jgi:tetratricopeptide (TPR) repeat protein
MNSETDPNDLGKQYLSEDDYEEAIAAFTQAISNDPKDVEAYRNRAETYCLLEDYEAASKDLLAVLDLDDGQKEVWQELADTYLSMGDVQKAAETFKQASDLFDDHAFLDQSQILLAEQYSDEELLDYANEQLTEARALEYIQLGAYFDYDGRQSMEIDGQRWSPVTDDRVNTLQDIQAIWHQVYSSDQEVNLNAFCEIDGKLYTNCMGVGDDISLLDEQITTVESRDGRTAELTGYVLRLEIDDNGQEQQKKWMLHYSMYFEEDVWKCAGFTEDDSMPVD